jgi:uncharacterized membrane protein
VDSYVDTIFGLPVHALVVHGAVVLIPLAAIGAILMALRPTFSRRYGLLVVLVAAAGAISAFVARLSGEQLAERVGKPEQHAELGTVLPFIATGFFVLLLVFWLFDRGIPANKYRPMWLVILAIVVILAACLAIFWTIRVGHTGTTAVWGSVIENTSSDGE